jgi:hypothetical protein
VAASGILPSHSSKEQPGELNRGFQQQESEAKEEETKFSPSDDIHGKRDDSSPHDEVVEDGYAENEAGALLTVSAADAMESNYTEADEERRK